MTLYVHTQRRLAELLARPPSVALRSAERLEVCYYYD